MEVEREIEARAEIEETTTAVIEVKIEAKFEVNMEEATEIADNLSSLNSSMEHMRILDKFTLFPTLPKELRWKIWYCAATSGRIVKWGRQETPAIFRTSHESRKEALRNTTLVICQSRSEEKYGFYINFQNDMLYRKTRLPSPAEVRSSFQTGLRTAIFHPSWTRRVQSLILPLGDVVSLIQQTMTSCTLKGFTWIEPNLWTNIQCMFPELKRLLVVLRPKLEASNMIEDLKIRSFDSASTIQVAMMTFIEKSYQLYRDYYGLLECQFERPRPRLFDLEFVGVVRSDGKKGEDS